MASYHDGNDIHTMLVVASNGKTLINLTVDPSSHSLSTSDGTSGSDNGPSISLHDANNVPILMGVSSVDGKTPVALYGDLSGQLLIDSI